MSLVAVVREVIQDRTTQAGGTFGTISLWGGLSVQQVHEWLGVFATAAGGLCALATLVYTCLKIRRLIKNPKAGE